MYLRSVPNNVSNFKISSASADDSTIKGFVISIKKIPNHCSIMSYSCNSFSSAIS